MKVAELSKKKTLIQYCLHREKPCYRKRVSKNDATCVVRGEMR